jgi:hypothetical protein
MKGFSVVFTGDEESGMREKNLAENRKKMKELNFPVDQIAVVSSLPLDEIAKL